MPDFTNCATCARLIDDKPGSLCDTCKSREETPFPVGSIARYFGQRVRVDAVDGTLRTVTHIDNDDNPVSEDEAPQEVVGVERLSPDYRRWTGNDDLRVGDVVIVDGDTTDDFYARIVDVELNSRAWFVITDKHGAQEEDEPDEYYISPNNRARPWADPIPNRMIASFASIEPLPFDGPVQDEAYPSSHRMTPDQARDYWTGPRNNPHAPAASECEYCSAPPQMPHLANCPNAAPAPVPIEDEILEWRIIRAWALTQVPPVGKNALWMLSLAAKYEQKLIDTLPQSDLDVALEDPRRPAPVDPRDTRIAELEAQVKAQEGQIGLFPVSVYNAYIDTQDSRLSQVPYAMACMALKDAMSRAILDRPTGFPIVPTGEA